MLRLASLFTRTRPGSADRSELADTYYCSDDTLYLVVDTAEAVVLEDCHTGALSNWTVEQVERGLHPI